MDFHSLSRKALQNLCKKNKIPANITNVAMADALSALSQVEGLDEFLNPTEAESGTPETHRTATRTSTRRKALKEEPQSSKVVSSQRLKSGTGAGEIDEGEVAEQENKDGNVLVTPAGRRRAPVASSCRKKASEMVKDDEKNVGKPAGVPITPAAIPSTRKRATGRSVLTRTEGTSVQKAYNTRRSVRLLEKNLSKMSLVEAEDTGLPKVDDVSEEVSSSISQQIEESADTEEVCDAGASVEVMSSLISEETDEGEVSSLEKKTEYECQVHDSGPAVQMVSDVENVVGACLEAEFQEEDLSKVDCLVADSEPHDSNVELEDGSETHDVSNEVEESYDVSTADYKAGSEMSAESEDSCDSSEAEFKGGLGTEQEALSVKPSGDASMEFTGQVSAVEAFEDAYLEVTEQDVASLSVESSDASMAFVEQKDAALTAEVADNASTEVDDSAWTMELPDNQGGKEIDDNDQDKNNGTEHLNVTDDNNIQPFKPVNHVDPSAADEFDEEESMDDEDKSENSKESMDEVEDMDKANGNSENSIDDPVVLCNESSAEESKNDDNVFLESPLLDDHQEESERLKESVVETETTDGTSDVIGASSAAKDASASFESLEDVNIVTLESSSVEVPVREAEDQKIDKCNEHVTTEKTALEDATRAFPCGPEIAEYENSDSNARVEAEVASEVIPKQDRTIIAAPPINQLKKTMQSADEPKGVANETVPKMSNAANRKEDLEKELLQKSIRELRKMVKKKLTIRDDDNSNCESKTSNNNVVKEVERKRTALQPLPENQMTKGEA